MGFRAMACFHARVRFRSPHRPAPRRRHGGRLVGPVADKPGPVPRRTPRGASLRPISKSLTQLRKECWGQPVLPRIVENELGKFAVDAEGKLRHWNLRRRWSGLHDASARWLAVQPTADVCDRILVEASVKAAGDIADMRRRQHVRQSAERVLKRQRLLVEDIDRCAGDLLVFKRLLPSAAAQRVGDDMAGRTGWLQKSGTCMARGGTKSSFRIPD